MEVGGGTDFDRRRYRREDYQHEFRGFHGPNGVCRVRIYTGSAVAPVVVCTALKRNRGAWLSYICEVLAAELLLQFFPDRLRESEPMIYLEHYPTGFFEMISQPTVKRVTFAPMVPRWEVVGERRRATWGPPSWRDLSPDEVRELIGEALE